MKQPEQAITQAFSSCELGITSGRVQKTLYRRARSTYEPCVNFSPKGIIKMTRGINQIALCLFFSAASLAPPCSASLLQVEKNDLQFSNTQKWGALYLRWAESPEIFPDIDLPPPPENDSKAVKKELKVLQEYQRARSSDQLKEINSEVDVYEARFGDQTFAQLVFTKKRPETHQLMNYFFQIETVNIMKQKKLHDRVRPSFLDSAIKPALAVPQHPSYPSGHATQAYLRALVLSELNPKNRRVYMQAAKRIARNREIAGLHYPSDSKAGFELAKQLFSKLKDDQNFKILFQKAKKEWP